jgi:flagellar biosynthesis component FlhA
VTGLFSTTSCSEGGGTAGIGGIKPGGGVGLHLKLIEGEIERERENKTKKKKKKKTKKKNKKKRESNKNKSSQLDRKENKNTHTHSLTPCAHTHREEKQLARVTNHVLSIRRCCGVTRGTVRLDQVAFLMLFPTAAFRRFA